tara:strand:+ start:146 stop:421 length:276 start_codon:yes stop_codon:yes gene_type:complete
LEIFEVSTVPSELLSSLKSGEGDRGRVITDNGEIFHVCIIPSRLEDVKGEKLFLIRHFSVVRQRLFPLVLCFYYTTFSANVKPLAHVFLGF